MATPDTINVAQLSRLIGTPEAPVIVDVRIDTDYASDPRMLPASIRRDYRTVSSWAAGICWPIRRRRLPARARSSARAWPPGCATPVHAPKTSKAVSRPGSKAGGLLVRPDHVPDRDRQGRTVWVTRARPKIDRIACPWLIRRFIDPSAVFLFVAPPEVADVGGSVSVPRRSTSRASSGAIAASSARSM